MRTSRKIVLLFLTSLSFSLPMNVAAQTLDFSKAWFKPNLAVNKDVVCTSLLAQAQQEFFSRSVAQRTLGEPPQGPIKADQYWTWLETTPFEGLALYQGTVYTRGYLGHGCGGACESEYFVVSKSPLNSGSYGDNLSLVKNQITDTVPAYAGNSGLYKHQNGSYYAITKGEVFSAYKPMPNAIWNKVCEITSTPSEAVYKKVTDTYSSIKKLNDTVDKIIGQEGNMCGSMHTLSRWKQLIQKNLEKTLYQPWTLHEPANSDSTYAINITNLESWALKDISQKMAFEEYKKQLVITTKDLSLFYQKNYQWPATTSDNMATNALKTAISSGIRFYMYEQVSKPQKALLDAITDNQSISVIKPLADAPDALKNINLSLAINHPQALELLLTKINNPNQQNEFNKSLLMYAAQYNQLESAKVLIKNKSDINLSTIIPNDTCNYTLSKFGMTALHYAVRYASYDFVKLLLDNGAYPYAKTSEQDGGYPIDWLKKYTAIPAQEKNPNITQEQAVALEASLKLPKPEEIAKKVLNYNIISEQEFSKGNIDSAYLASKYALGLDEHNERALANFSLIALKMNKQLESLEASYNLTNFGKDTNQIANAWFNYGLTCATGKFSYENYNGVSHCRNLPIYYFMNSFNKKPSTTRANKIVESLKKGETPSCQFKKGNINLLITLSTYGSEKNLYVLTPKTNSLDTSKIFWYTEHETKDANNVKTKTRTKKFPEKVVNSYDLGDFTMNIYQSDETIYTPIEFDGETCNSQSFGVFTVKQSDAK